MTPSEAAAVLPQVRFYLHTWQTFFTSRREPLIRWIMRRCKLQRADAEDCFQDACMKMYQRLETIDGTREQSFHTYLKTVLFHSAVDRLRRDSRPGARGAGSAGEVDPMDQAERKSGLRDFWTGCEDLHQEAKQLAVAWGRGFFGTDWEMFSRKCTDDVDCETIARDMGIPKARVYRTRHRIAEAVRDKYQSLLTELQSTFFENG
jgi:RNA polymerase sigma factor (sigma-70 family)